MAIQGAARTHAVSGMRACETGTDGGVYTLRTAVGGVEVIVGPGEVLALAGAGSRTALTAAAAAERIGDVAFDGLSMSRAAELRRRVIGTTTTDHRLVPSLTVLGNVALPLELDGWNRGAAREAAHEALGLVDLAHRADLFPDDLSAARRRAVALARGVVGGRLLVLSDEPLDVLHVTLLRRLAANGSAVLARTTALVRPTWADRLVVVPAAHL
ncbi:ATP-binding cassette domain-containing protein [Curtobacterium oceanosedimentum]|nr:ATP-binding cassette domain-containing protein [Curtobacterium oceanosedimentum]